MYQPPPETSWLSYYSTLTVFLFASLALIVPSGYSIGAALLLLGGLYTLPQRPLPALDKKSLALLIVLALFSLEGVLNIFWHQLSSSHYDKVLRFALAIPAFYLIRKANPKISWLWLGLAVGALGAGSLAFYEKFIVGLPRPGGFTHPIQFGNLSMLLGLFCLAGTGWAVSQPAGSSANQRRSLFLLLLTLGAAGGITGSLLSGSRGGWIGLPLMLLFLVKAYYSLFSRRTKVMALAALLIGVTALYHTPQTQLKSRIYIAVEDIKAYQQGYSSSSIGARFEMWKGAAQLFLAKPIMGWGQSHYQPAMADLVEQHQAHPTTRYFTHAHNDMLDRAAKHGLVGVLMLLALYAVPIWYFFPYTRHQNLTIRSLAVAGTLLPIAYIDFGLSQAFLRHNSGVMMYAFWLVIWAALLQNNIATYNITYNDKK